MEIFKHYEDNEISFVGNYGRMRSGKSFWYDKILNLSQFDGNKVEFMLFSIVQILENRASISGVFLLPKEILNFSYWTMLDSMVRIH